MRLNTTIEHKGTTYAAVHGVVTDTHLGYEDHGIFSMNIDFKGVGSSWGQGLAHRFMTEDPWMRVWITALVDVFGGPRWEDIPGRQIWVLHTENDPYGPIVGLAHESNGNILIFQELIESVEGVKG